MTRSRAIHSSKVKSPGENRTGTCIIHHDGLNCSKINVERALCETKQQEKKSYMKRKVYLEIWNEDKWRTEGEEKGREGERREEKEKEEERVGG